MFDLAKLDTLTASEAGVAMQVIHPKTKEPVKGADGEVITITLLGRASDAAQAAVRRARDRANERLQQGRRSTPEDAERDMIDLLVSCTKAWTFDSLDGQPFPCTPGNAELLWRDPRFRWLREQALIFIQDDGNFLRD